MSVYPILFEDSSLAGFRPLAWSAPVYELRCGILNTRERVGLGCGRRRGPQTRGIGGLLCRPFLEPLHTAKGWTVGAEAIARELGNGDDTVLWINGRVGADAALLGILMDWAQVPGNRFRWVDDLGLLAACLTSAQSRPLLESWNTWQQVAADAGCWHRPEIAVPTWGAADLLPPPAQILELETSCFRFDGQAVPDLPGLAPGRLGFIWDLGPATNAAIAKDLAFLEGEAPWHREPFGLTPAEGVSSPFWHQDSRLQPATARLAPTALQAFPISGGEQLYLGEDVTLAAGTAIDTTRGPVILDFGVRVMPHVFLEGPLYVGPGSIIKAGACLYGESSFGIGNRLSGEIGESTFGDFANKQHDGFIGHAVLGSWVNLGAMTTCSDLKNNYGPVRVDLGQGQVDSGQRFVGLLMGDHAKTAIGSLFNTGTSVGFASNIFGDGMPPKFVGNFQWGGRPGCPRYEVHRAVETAALVMPRRGCQLSAAHRALFHSLADG